MSDPAATLWEPKIRDVLRHSIVQGHVFEELGVTYVGPVDGHDVNYLVESLERVRELDGVVLLHTLTQKGKGHPKALSHPERVHAAKGEPRNAPAHKLFDAVTVERRADVKVPRKFGDYEIKIDRAAIPKDIDPIERI